MHVLLWLLTQGIVEAAPKWSCDRKMNGQSRGRPSHFKPGSALVAEPVGPGNLQPSRHAIGRMARGMHSATSLSVKLQALVSCVGTIDMAIVPKLLNWPSDEPASSRMEHHTRRSKSRTRSWTPNRPLTPRRLNLIMISRKSADAELFHVPRHALR